MKLSEYLAQIAEIIPKLDKIKDEMLAEIAKLEDSLSDVEVPQAGTDALDTIKAKLQAWDDIVPDQPVP